jgi:hypothetical protein
VAEPVVIPRVKGAEEQPGIKEMAGADNNLGLLLLEGLLEELAVSGAAAESVYMVI